MLKGEKVILRAVEKDDLKRLWELEQNVDLLEWSQPDWMPKSLAAREKEYEKQIEERHAERIDFVIEADGKVIGRIGIVHQNRMAHNAIFGMGIFDREYLGRGYGRDAVRVFIDWAFRILNFRRLSLDVLAPNERAIEAYQACGFREEARLRQHSVFRGQPVDLIYMGLLRSEWQHARVARP